MFEIYDEEGRLQFGKDIPNYALIYYGKQPYTTQTLSGIYGGKVAFNAVAKLSTYNLEQPLMFVRSREGHAISSLGLDWGGDPALGFVAATPNGPDVSGTADCWIFDHVKKYPPGLPNFGLELRDGSETYFHSVTPPLKIVYFNGSTPTDTNFTLPGASRPIATAGLIARRDFADSNQITLKVPKISGMNVTYQEVDVESISILWTTGMHGFNLYADVENLPTNP